MLRFPYVYTSPKRIQADGKPVLSLVDGYSESLCASNRFAGWFSSGKVPKVIANVVIGAELARLENFMISKSAGAFRLGRQAQPKQFKSKFTT